MQGIRVHPSLRACLGWAFTMVSSVFALLLIIQSGTGRLTWDKARLVIEIMCLIGGGLGLFLYGVGWAFATTLNDEGLHGPTLLGVRRAICWNDIGLVRRVVVKGIPYLLIRSHSSKEEIWFCVLGFSEKLILERLQDFIPANDPDKLSEILSNARR
jgi:hypothetical protein